jgi:hypothetical protein
MRRERAGASGSPGAGGSPRLQGVEQMRRERAQARRTLSDTSAARQREQGSASTVSGGIDFSKWTQAQLEAGIRVAERSPASRHRLPAMRAALAAKDAAGSDQSRERVADMVARNPGLRRGRRR